VRPPITGEIGNGAIEAKVLMEEGLSTMLGILAATNPFSRNLQSTLDAAGSKRKINLSPELIWENFANDACPITRGTWG
jgi:hypothetical protein